MKSYKDYSWLGMTMEETLKSLKVKELNKYLDNHRIHKSKDNIIKAIMCNVLQENQNIITKKSIEISNEESDNGEDCYSSDEETDTDSDEGEHSETEQSAVSQLQNSSVNEISDWFTSRTRPGRVAGSWRRSLLVGLILKR